MIIQALKDGRFLLFFLAAYLHDPGALGAFAGSRPAEHEHNLRFHYLRYPVKQAPHPLRHTADHKPAAPTTDVNSQGKGTEAN